MDSLVFRAERMFDGLTTYGASTVEVTDGVITSVHTPGAVPANDLEVIDLGPDSFLLPGLIDCHVHLSLDASPDPVSTLIAVDNETLRESIRSAALRTVRAGITTVRDLGDRDYLTLAVAAELAPEQGPDILSAGPPITIPGGHAHFLGGETTPDALLSAVRERHDRGCSVIKVMASGGTMTRNSTPPYGSQYTLGELRVVVDEAHRLGLPVAAHAHGTPAIRDAWNAGVDTIEHASFMGADGPDLDFALIASIASSSVHVSTTIGHLPTDPPLVLTPEQLKVFGGAFTSFERLHELGAGLVLGTDAGTSALKPHDVLPHAIEGVTAHGPSNLEALTMATSTAAKVCGVSDRKGHIRVGADADLLAVSGDPLSDLTHLRDIRAIYRAGIKVA